MNVWATIKYRTRAGDIVDRDMIPVRIKFGEHTMYPGVEQWILVAHTTKNPNQFVEYAMQHIIEWRPR